MNIEDISCTNEAIHRLISLGQEEMPDAAGIADFDYRPSTPKFEAAAEGKEVREASRDAKAAPVVQDPLLLIRGKSR
jgi:hypothetical protein